MELFEHIHRMHDIQKTKLLTFGIMDWEDKLGCLHKQRCLVQT